MTRTMLHYIFEKCKTIVAVHEHTSSNSFIIYKVLDASYGKSFNLNIAKTFLLSFAFTTKRTFPLQRSRMSLIESAVRSR